MLSPPKDLFKAINFVFAAHSTQFRKYSGQPYAAHPVRVAMSYLSRGDSTACGVIAALLHDVIEDYEYTKTTLDIVREEFGEDVAALVSSLTNPSKGVSLPRVARKAMDREHLQNASQEVRVIKLLDRIDNIKDLGNSLEEDTGFVYLYIEESFLLLEALSGTDEELEKELFDTLVGLQVSLMKEFLRP